MKCLAIIEDYYYDGCGDDGCSFYDDAQCAGNCHHDHFKKTMPLKEKFGNKVKTCCSGHQYFFFDQCEVCNRRLVGSTNQANPIYFYFRIS